MDRPSASPLLSATLLLTTAAACGPSPSDVLPDPGADGASSGTTGAMASSTSGDVPDPPPATTDTDGDPPAPTGGTTSGQTSSTTSASATTDSTTTGGSTGPDGSTGSDPSDGTTTGAVTVTASAGDSGSTGSETSADPGSTGSATGEEPPPAGTLVWDWIRSDFDDDNDHGVDVAVGGDGAVYAVGDIDGYLGSMYIKKMWDYGGQSWSREFIVSSDVASVTVDSDENPIVLGDTWDNDEDLWMRKFDPVGEIVWDVYDVDVHGNDIAAGDAGTFYVAGFVTADVPQLSAWLRKYDASGTPLWSRTVVAPQGATMRWQEVEFTDAGDVIVVGYRRQTSGVEDIVLAGYDSDGASSWTTSHPALGRAYDADVDPLGNIVVAGATAGDPWVRKYDPTGSQLWALMDPGPSLRGVATDASGNIAAIGGSFDIWIRAFAPDSSPLWEIEMDGDDGEQARGRGIEAADDVWVAVGSIEDEDELEEIWIAGFAP